jgi:glycosyltransferase involved in cell wall biosynthesis
MNDTPLVSVLMTAYNREAYIAEAIASVVASDFDDWELIIVDDGSSDQTVWIAREWAAKDPRIQVYQNPKNLGDYPNRNQAASYARGKYLKYVDADDYIYPHGLSVIVKMMEAFPESGYGLCSLDQDLEKPFPFVLSPREAYVRHYFQTPLFHKAPLSAVIHRPVFEDVGGFPLQRMTSDFAMWQILSQHHNVVLMPSGLVWYREHSSQEVNEISRNPLFYNFAYQNVMLAAIGQSDCPLEQSERRLIKKRALISNLKMALREMKNFNFVNVLKIGTQMIKMHKKDEY